MEGLDKDVEKKDDDDLERTIKILRDKEFRVIAFDMDQTAVAMHSRGRLRRDRLDYFLDHATPDFVRLVPALYAEGFSLAIATHSDEAEFHGSSTKGIQRQTHILGHELATALVRKHFSKEIADAFFIVAYNPCVRKLEPLEEDNRIIKRFHMRQIQTHFGMEPAEIIFFDDTEQIVKDCNEHCHVRTIRVDRKLGFRLSDVLQLEY